MGSCFFPVLSPSKPSLWFHPDPFSSLSLGSPFTGPFFVDLNGQMSLQKPTHVQSCFSLKLLPFSIFPSPSLYSTLWLWYLFTYPSSTLRTVPTEPDFLVENNDCSIANCGLTTQPRACASFGLLWPSLISPDSEALWSLSPFVTLNVVFYTTFPFGPGAPPCFASLPGPSHPLPQHQPCAGHCPRPHGLHSIFSCSWLTFPAANRTSHFKHGMSQAELSAFALKIPILCKWHHQPATFIDTLESDFPQLIISSHCLGATWFCVHSVIQGLVPPPWSINWLYSLPGFLVSKLFSCQD